MFDESLEPWQHVVNTVLRYYIGKAAYVGAWWVAQACKNSKVWLTQQLFAGEPGTARYIPYLDRHYDELLAEGFSEERRLEMTEHSTRRRIEGDAMRRIKQMYQWASDWRRIRSAWFVPHPRSLVKSDYWASIEGMQMASVALGTVPNEGGAYSLHLEEDYQRLRNKYPDESGWVQIVRPPLSELACNWDQGDYVRLSEATWFTLRDKIKPLQILRVVKR